MRSVVVNEQLTKGNEGDDVVTHLVGAGQEFKLHCVSVWSRDI